MSVQITESIPKVLQGATVESDPKSTAKTGINIAKEIDKQAGSVLESQINRNIAALEEEGRETLMNAEIPSASKESDKAELSETAKNRELSPEQRKLLMMKWTLEQLGETWLLLLNFMPLQGEDPLELLNRLNTLYHLLELEILKNTFGPARQQEMTKLERAFSAALNRIWEFSIKDITSFFEQYGTKEQVNWLKSGLYHLASGERLSGKKLEHFWQAGSESKGNAGNKGSENRNYEAFTKTGMIYKASGKGVTFIHEQATPLSTLPEMPGGRTEQSDIQEQNGMSQKVISRQTGTFNSVGAPEQNGTAGRLSFTDKQGLFSASDLRNADSFLKYIVKEGNLFSQPYLNSRHEELLGILSAITVMKCREFCDKSKMGSAMRKELQTAADNYIERTVAKAVRQSSQEEASSGKSYLLQQKEVYKIYYYTMNQYQKSERANHAILQGLKYAVEVFREKKLNAMFPQQRYGPGYEFFHTGWGKAGQEERMRADLKMGGEILERDWNGFLKYMGKPNESRLSLAALLQTRRPPHIKTEPFEAKKRGGEKNLRLIMAIAIGVLMLSLSVWLAFY